MDVIPIRASSFPDLFDCPARWYAKHVENMRLPLSPALILGKAIHASTAVYDTSFKDGDGITIDESAGALVDTIKKDKGVKWDDMSSRDAEKIGISLHKKYCNKITPIQKYVGVEVTCDDLTISDIGLKITGTTDRVRVTEGGLYGISDIKTGGAQVGSDGSVKTQGSAAQIAVYEVLASASMGINISAQAQIIGINTGKTEKAQRVATGGIDGARDMLIGNEYTPGLLEYASKILHGGVFYGNPRSILCNVKYCPVYNNCRYRK